MVKVKGRKYILRVFGAIELCPLPHGAEGLETLLGGMTPGWVGEDMPNKQGGPC